MFGRAVCNKNIGEALYIYVQYEQKCLAMHKCCCWYTVFDFKCRNAKPIPLHYFSYSVKYKQIDYEKNNALRINLSNYILYGKQ